jgi:hypothetical protein
LIYKKILLIVYILAAITTLIIAITKTIRRTDAIKTALTMSIILMGEAIPGNGRDFSNTIERLPIIILRLKESLGKIFHLLNQISH